MSVLSFNVIGWPAPQGSKRAFRNQHTGRIQMVESSKKVAPWRDAVIAAAEKAIDEAEWEHRGLPVRLTVDFYLPRPKGHFGSGRNAHMLRPAAPQWPASVPDLEKLDRSTRDALTLAGVWADDARVVVSGSGKHYADHNRPGAHITVELLTQDRAAYRRQSLADVTLPPGRDVQDAPAQEALL